MRNRAMATYVMSDIHGEYEKFIDLLDKIELKDTDTLYVLGDIVDRGLHPIQVIRKLMLMPNVICLVGNHELMALENLEFLMQEVTSDTINKLNEDMLEGLLVWRDVNGGQTTINEFRTLNREGQREVIEFLRELYVYEEISVEGKDYILVHAGLGGYNAEKSLEDYSLKELLWDRADYNIMYDRDKYVVTGHTPTQYILENPKPGYIYKHNHHIAIDCGAYLKDGRLAAICLETGKEYYSFSNNVNS